MISQSHVTMMARYNRWQNGCLYRAAETLDDAAREKDRGAFWGSISGTLTHLLWGDGMWMGRLDGGAQPDRSIAKSPVHPDGWDGLVRDRLSMDDRIDAWAASVGDIPDERVLTFYSGILDAEVSKPLALCVTHFFNHQTHHRGQVHAMLTAAGAKTEDTDLIFMPDAG